jgi:hypothetical protein
VDSIIPPKQGFFVKVTSGNTSGTISVGNDARIHCQNRPVYKAHKIEKPFVLQMFVTSDVTTYSDEALVVFNKEASNDFDDNFDAFKIPGQESAPQLYTQWYNTKYAVNTLKEMEDNMVIPLNFEAGINGVYTLDFNTGNLPVNAELYLEDTQLNKWQNLQVNSIYSFAANTEDEAGRFLLHFGAPNQVDELSSTDDVNVYSFERTIHIETPQDFKGQVIVYDILGQEITNSTISNQNTEIVLNSPADYYIVKISSPQFTKSYRVLIK